MAMDCVKYRQRCEFFEKEYLERNLSSFALITAHRLRQTKLVYMIYNLGNNGLHRG